MLGHLTIVPHLEKWQVIDMFAGRARIAKMAHALGLKAVAVDRDFDKEGDNKRHSNCMDLNTSGGFLLLVC